MPEEAGGVRSPDERIAHAIGEAARAQNVDLVTLDFWDTLVLRTEDPDDVRHRVCCAMVERLGLSVTPEGLGQLHADAAGALRSAGAQLGLDDEYRSRTAWTGILRELLPAGDDIGAHVEMAERLEVEMHAASTRISAAVKSAIHDLDRPWCIVSDNEMSAEQLVAIAAVHGLDVPRVHVSSASGFTKRSGRLFGHVQAEEGVAAAAMFHVGDDPTGDRWVPLRLGLRVPQQPLPERAWVRDRTAALPVETVQDPQVTGPRELGRTVAHFINLVRSEAVAFQADRVLFIGSEGAFFSTFFAASEDSSQASTQCVNLGRRHLLGAALAADPSWVIHRCLVSGIPVASVGAVVADPLGSSPASKAEQVGSRLVERYWREGSVEVSELPLPAEEYARCRDLRARQLGLSEQQSVVVVDVGYRATTAMAIARAFGVRTLSVAMFGESAYLSASHLEHRWWLEVEGRQWGAAGVTSGAVVPKDTPPLEILLATGPRAPRGDDRLNGARSLVLRSVTQALSEPDEVPSATTDADEWRRFLSAPPAGLARSILDAAHEDDLHHAGGAAGPWRPRFLAHVELWPGGARVAHPVLGSQAGEAVLDAIRIGRQAWKRVRARVATR